MKLNNYMKQKLKGAMLLISLGLSSVSAFAQMSGSYTIDPAAAATATNFTSWTSFATSFNAASIAGPVTVNVKASTNIGLNAIAQWTYLKQNKMPQGLGTGALYTNNFDCQLEVSIGQLWFKKEKEFHFNFKEN